MTCSISRMVSPSFALSSRNSATMWSVSVGRRPAITSSSSSRRGPVASARATSSRLRSGSVSEAASWSRLLPRPSCSMTAVAPLACASRTLAASVERADDDVLHHRQPGERLAPAGTCGRCRRGRSGRRAGRRCACRAKPHLAGIGAIDAGDQVEAGGLAGAVRADQRRRWRLPAPRSSRPARPQAAEALGDAVDARAAPSWRDPRRAATPSPSAPASGGHTPSGRNITTQQQADAVEHLLDAGDVDAEGRASPRSASPSRRSAGRRRRSARTSVPMPPMIGPEDQLDGARDVEHLLGEQVVVVEGVDRRRRATVMAADEHHRDHLVAEDVDAERLRAASGLSRIASQ